MVAGQVPIVFLDHRHAGASQLRHSHAVHARMAARIIESVDVEPAPLRMVLGSQALAGSIAALEGRLAGFRAQTELAASTDFPAGE